MVYLFSIQILLSVSVNAEKDLKKKSRAPSPDRIPWYAEVHILYTITSAKFTRMTTITIDINIEIVLW